ncbi:hypothetical protein M427DRAFT_27288 [Gonapodya prolifera JEL478]|uniref:BAR domain-containing protein n=1 Tax=Gonapodya prolifera (strain JEL478) TaxID=1344416 RepID=A0A139AYB4_GONPJ|nr:hypothetical protein M427DRAFT_27288 [Gonapodya prolifera JEL478]|eukprot:KXS21694.1 hypothetical protein M427DRAFT_27288 [Gonapodya prolifera JEL478]
MADLRDLMAGYLRNVERLREKSVKISKALQTFANDETPLMRNFLSDTSKIFEEGQEPRKRLHDRLAAKVLQPLETYKTKCKTLREQERNRDRALDKEVNKRRLLDRSKTKDLTHPAKIAKSEGELIGARHETVQSTLSLIRSVVDFEVHKIADVQELFKEFFFSELQYHVRSIELLTEAHRFVSEIDCSADVQEITDRMRLTESDFRDRHWNDAEIAEFQRQEWEMVSPLSSHLAPAEGEDDVTPTSAASSQTREREPMSAQSMSWGAQRRQSAPLHKVDHGAPRYKSRAEGDLEP